MSGNSNTLNNQGYSHQWRHSLPFSIPTLFDVNTFASPSPEHECITLSSGGFFNGLFRGGGGSGAVVLPLSWTLH